MLWLKTCGPASSTRATASRSPQKSGVSTSTRACGKRAPHLAHGVGEMARAAVLQVVAVHAGDHHVAQLHFGGHARHVGRLGGVEAHIRACAGLPLGTEQKPQPRVQRSPRIMNVAAPRWKHSWMLGQRADSHTVCRFSEPEPALEPVERFEMRAALARPLRKPGPRSCAELYQGIAHATSGSGPDGRRRFPAPFWRGPAPACRRKARSARGSGCWGRAAKTPGSPCPSWSGA